MSSINPASGQYECHTARPSEVVEILSKPVNCFVATAAYGSPMASEVNTFRAFRDRFLVPTWLGKKFVRFYYNYGPILARAIAGNEFRKTIARAALAAPLVFVKFALNNGGPAAIALLIVIFAVPVVGGVLVWRKRKRGARA